MKGACRCFLTLLTFLCLFKVCELCSTVRASRASKFVPAGSLLQLSCEVLHCGETLWTGGWSFQDVNSTEFTLLTSSDRIKLSENSPTANNTHLLIDIHNINQSDAGAYKCVINWPNNVSSAGHVTYVNVTAAGENSSGRSLSHRVLLVLCVFVCFSVALGAFWYMSRDKPPPPPVPPHPRSSFAARVKPKKEVVYAEVALNNSRVQNNQQKQAPESTVYSALQFS